MHTPLPGYNDLLQANTGTLQYRWLQNSTKFVTWNSNNHKDSISLDFTVKYEEEKKIKHNQQ
jgi:hypothetical protein